MSIFSSFQIFSQSSRVWRRLRVCTCSSRFNYSRLPRTTASSVLVSPRIEILQFSDKTVHYNSTKLFSQAWMKYPMFQFFPITIFPVTENSLAMSSSNLPVKYCIIYKLLHICPRLNACSCLSVSLYVRESSPLSFSQSFARCGPVCSYLSCTEESRLSRVLQM